MSAYQKITPVANQLLKNKYKSYLFFIYARRSISNKAVICKYGLGNSGGALSGAMVTRSLPSLRNTRNDKLSFGLNLIVCAAPFP